MDFKFPDVGEGIHEGKIVKWLIKEGDQVKADQALAEIETDKAVVEIPSPKSGKIIKLYHKATETIKVGEILATIETSETTSTGTEKRESTGVVGSLEPTAIGVMKAPSLVQSGAVFGSKDVSSSNIENKKEIAAKPQIIPSAKANIAPKEATAIGVVKSGIKAIKKYDLFGYIEHIPYEGIRKTIGDHMVKAVSSIPHVTHSDTADVTELWELREKEKVQAEKENIHLTFMAYFLRATVAALKKHPFLNATLDESNHEIIVKKYYNIGIAVDTDVGLMAPVLKGADKKSIFQIAQELGILAEKARSRKINPMDLKGGTFTISNVGSIGSGEFFTPIINYPEVAILGIGLIKDMPAVYKGKIASRKILYLSLSFDHRVVDGAEAARFMKTFIELLGAPATF